MIYVLEARGCHTCLFGRPELTPCHHSCELPAIVTYFRPDRFKLDLGLSKNLMADYSDLLIFCSALSGLSSFFFMALSYLSFTMETIIDNSKASPNILVKEISFSPVLTSNSSIPANFLAARWCHRCSFFIDTFTLYHELGYSWFVIEET